MTLILAILLAIAIGGVLVTLLVGIIVMTRGGKTDQHFGNRLMWLRVALQLLAVALFVLLILSRRG